MADVKNELAQLQSEPEEEMYPKRFVEWLGREANLYEYFEGIEWTFNCDEGIDTLPLEQVFDYWQSKVKNEIR
jgi:hypothetical protein